MASLYISEFESITPTTEGGAAQVARVPAVAKQKLTITGTANPSAAFNQATRYIRVHTDAICSIAFGAAPVADATDARMAADQTEYFGVTAGQKISVISNT